MTHLTYQDIEAMDDNELARHLNGAYGPEKRKTAIGTVRRSLAKARARDRAVVDDIFRRHEPDGPTAA